MANAQIPQGITDFVNALIKDAPKLFDQLVLFADTLVSRNSGDKIPTMPDNTPNGPIDVTADTGDGNYVLVSTGLDPKIKEAIINNIAEGQVREKAGEFFSGFLMALSLVGGAGI